MCSVRLIVFHTPCVPFGEYATYSTVPVCPSNSCRMRRFSRSQSQTVFWSFPSMNAAVPPMRCVGRRGTWQGSWACRAARRIRSPCRHPRPSSARADPGDQRHACRPETGPSRPACLCWESTASVVPPVFVSHTPLCNARCIRTARAIGGRRQLGWERCQRARTASIPSPCSRPRGGRVDPDDRRKRHAGHPRSG